MKATQVGIAALLRRGGRWSATGSKEGLVVLNGFAPAGRLQQRHLSDGAGVDDKKAKLAAFKAQQLAKQQAAAAAGEGSGAGGGGIPKVPTAAMQDAADSAAAPAAPVADTADAGAADGAAAKVTTPATPAVADKPAAAPAAEAFVDDFKLGPPSVTVKRLCDEVLALNVIEMHMLLTTLQSRLGISDDMLFTGGGGGGGAPAAGGGGAAPAAAAAEPAKEKEAFDVKLTVVAAASKIKIIKEVRTITGLGLKEVRSNGCYCPEFILLISILSFDMSRHCRRPRTWWRRPRACSKRG